MLLWAFCACRSLEIQKFPYENPTKVDFPCFKGFPCFATESNEPSIVHCVIQHMSRHMSRHMVESHIKALVFHVAMAVAEPWRMTEPQLAVYGEAKARVRRCRA